MVTPSYPANCSDTCAFALSLFLITWGATVSKEMQLHIGAGAQLFVLSFFISSFAALKKENESLRARLIQEENERARVVDALSVAKNELEGIREVLVGLKGLKR
ncbi:hypothetical protein THAOC_01007 [Thalassiosira oceanica]|uniref:Uncharacterized protein n=1 Tax=Thalassiosira oceanica TaxID=159749 RepID=K0TEQ3_THAOC|nr:hypothetical protein THAOC_01007 [Thalassiosira oceanica]|eukprot:EJK77178.1 hypothetical protein THAOC_01007 [Thalassiosira oceanica]